MESKIQEKDGVQIITISGKIMGSPEDNQVSEIFLKLISDNKIYVILDLSEVTWMNSSGLGMCVGGLTRLRNRGGDLRLVGLPPVIESLMDRCRVLQLFQTYDNTDEALQSF
jgi:anti-sigma B factor antagonist